MAVTAVTITSGPTVVGRSVTLSGTLNHDGGGTNNTLNFLCYTVGYVTLGTLTRLSDNATAYNAGTTAGTAIAWTWTGVLPEGDWLAVTVNLNDSPYTLLATSATNVGLIELRKPLGGIWTPRRDSRGLFVERFPKPLSYKDTWNGGVISQYRRTFHYPTADGRIYWSAVDNVGREGEYGLLPKPAYTPHGPGIDVPQGWEWSVTRYGSTNTPGGYSTSTIAYVSVFHIHNANVRVDNATMTYPAILGLSRYNRSEVLAYWSNSSGEQSIKFGTGTYAADSLQNISIDGIGNGLHCLVVLQRNDTSTDGHRVYLDGKLVGSATGLWTYLGALDLRPYYWGGSISQSHLNVGNILFQGAIDKFYPTDAQAAEISRDPYRLFFRDAPTIRSKRVFLPLSIPTSPKLEVGRYLPRRWRTQPQGSVQIDWNHPITKDLFFAYVPTNPYNLAARSGEIPIGYNTSTEAGIAGIINTNNAVYSSGINYTSGPFTVGFPGQQYGEEVGNIDLLWDDGYYFVANKGNSYYEGTFSYTFKVTQSNNTSIIASATGQDAGLLSKRTRFLASTAESGDPIKIYLGRTLLQTGSSNWDGTLQASTNFKSLIVRSGWGGGGFATGGFIWHRVLSTNELSMMDENPWQIFKPLTSKLYSFSNSALKLTRPPNTYLQYNINAVASSNIDCRLGNYFTKTISGNTTFTVSNVPSNMAYKFILKLTVNAGSVTWWNNIVWPNSVAPTLTVGKTHLLTFQTLNGGSTWRGSYITNYSR